MRKDLRLFAFGLFNSKVIEVKNADYFQTNAFTDING